MGKWVNFANFFQNDEMKYFYESRYEDVSEPLKEWFIDGNGTCYEGPNSNSLLGVRVDGKWGWIDINCNFIIPHVYDNGWALCHNGIVILDRNGYQGGLYRDNQMIAFSFKYKSLGQFYRDTFCAWNSNNRCALVKPGDIMLTDFIYLGFSKNNDHNITEFVRIGLFGQKRGKIDLNTGREI